jgi:DNA invertase Pin-like site-specific DNA recombinase
VDATAQSFCRGTVGRHRHQHGRLMIAVLGGLADVERDLIRTRTAKGRSRAKAHGQQMGRPPAQSGATEGGHRTPREGRYARRTRPQLRRGKEHDFEAVGIKPRFLAAFKSGRSGIAKRFGASCNKLLFRSARFPGRST